jgi:alkaline phosphatase D
MDRRAFLKVAGGTVAGAATAASALDLTSLPAAAHAAAAAPAARLHHAPPPLPAPPFTLGVASGDPLPDGVVLWTRLAPDPLVPGGGMPPQPLRVEWQVASDDRFRRVVRRGATHARPEDGHSVHVEVNGLRPDATYWYRFRAAGETSSTGRTRTAPRAHGRLRHLRFATASCQQWQDGFYTAHRAMAQEDLAFVAFLGDYIYESRPSATAVRRHNGTGEPMTLDDYRARHALYRTDPDLQACHAAFPWIVTPDDHEVDNNWADEIPQDPAAQPHDQFLARRAAAFKAYYEHMPLRRRSVPDGIDMQLYRRFVWGDLLQLDVLDGRQFRTDQPVDLAGANAPEATMLGFDQERWLSRGLARSRTLWNGLAQQVMVAQNDRTAGPVETYDFDNWDGYRAARQRLLADLLKVDNPVVLTGDRHATWICDLKQDFYDPASQTVGAELTGTSITSGSDAIPEAFHAVYDPIKAESPHWKFIDNGRGYLVCDLDRQRWHTDLRLVSTVRAQDATVATAASFVTEAGRRGVEVT